MSSKITMQDVSSRTSMSIEEIFGTLKKKNRMSGQEFKDEVRAGWLSKSDREREKKWAKKRKGKGM